MRALPVLQLGGGRPACPAQWGASAAPPLRTMSFSLNGSHESSHHASPRDELGDLFSVLTGQRRVTLRRRRAGSVDSQDAPPLGDIDYGVLRESDSSVLAKGLWIAFTLLFAVLLLNVLIAMMGFTFRAHRRQGVGRAAAAARAHHPRGRALPLLLPAHAAAAPRLRR